MNRLNDEQLNMLYDRIEQLEEENEEIKRQMKIILIETEKLDTLKYTTDTVTHSGDILNYAYMRGWNDAINTIMRQAPILKKIYAEKIERYESEDEL